MFRIAKIVLVLIIQVNIGLAQDSACASRSIDFLKYSPESVSYCQNYLSANYLDCKAFLKAETDSLSLKYTAQYMGYEVKRWFRAAQIIGREKEADYFDYASGRLILLRFNCDVETLAVGEDYVIASERVYTIDGEVETIIDLTVKVPAKRSPSRRFFAECFPHIMITEAK